jgi:hypothetical protein
MAKLTAYGKVFRDWEALLGACQQNAAQLPGFDALRGEMEGVLARARELKIAQENLGGARKEATQRLRSLLEDGQETARKIRAFVQVHFGSKSERLSQFGIVPNGRKSRKSKLGVQLPPKEEVEGSSPRPAPEG